ncbi:protein of unknown function (plasmid) [Agrobacterium pusense]|uniref:Uncharacterized protein n=1 Tax=Agrobacterium pusense TaxID=648995 RepID=U4QIJ4_9HYPH|nr:protein of unknown function [Agrobacterium pusense]
MSRSQLEFINYARGVRYFAVRTCEPIVCAAITVISMAANIVDKVTIMKSFGKCQCLRRGRADAVQAAPHYN